VAVSEDGTRITSRIEYDSKNNQLVGLVAPLDRNGIPKKLYFSASSAKQIVKFFQERSKAVNAIVVMVQPMADGNFIKIKVLIINKINGFNFSFSLDAPSFVLSIMGTDNKFKSTDVKNRWSYIRREFQKYNITVISYNTDGDSKYLSAMRDMMNYGKMSYVFETLCPINMDGDTLTLQDSPHKVNNLKNMFMDLASNLRMGIHQITVNHLKQLVKECDKNIHLLNRYELDNVDRMNYSIVDKIATENIEFLLQLHVTESRATVVFLRMMRYILEAYTKENLTALERLYKSFYVLFVMRIWKFWCLSSENGSVDNFISQECFVALELNTWGLLKYLLLCRDKYGDSAFKIAKNTSQYCEEYFRELRYELAFLI
jgi:hypothetical protein